MKIALLCVVALAWLQIALVINVLTMRLRYKVAFSAPEDPNHPLYRGRLALSNATEYGPMLAILMLCLEMYGHQLLVAPPLYILACVARYLHAIGLANFSPEKGNVFRTLGTVGTLISFIGLSLCLAYQAAPGMLK
jgi:uncharacterized membrane protein YecN with MAPEG domain